MVLGGLKVGKKKLFMHRVSQAVQLLGPTHAGRVCGEGLCVCQRALLRNSPSSPATPRRQHVFGC
jgi:hypothetical protein